MSNPRSTLIEIRDFISNLIGIRKPYSNIGDYDDLVEYCFNAFDRDERYFRLHLHFIQETRCTDDAELLTKERWDNGAYNNAAERRFYAHFVTRLRGQPRGYVKRAPTVLPDSPTPEPVISWTQPPLPRVDEQGVIQPFAPSGTTSMADASASAPTPRRRRLPPPAQPSSARRAPLQTQPSTPRRAPQSTQPSIPRRAPQPAQPPPAVSRQPTQPPTPRPVPPPSQLPPAVPQPVAQHRNTNSTTVYSLPPPRPRTRYPNSTYFSTAYTFIPIPPAARVIRSHAQQYTAHSPDLGFLMATRAPAAAPAVPRPAPAAFTSPQPARRQPVGSSTARQPPADASNHPSYAPQYISSEESSPSLSPSPLPRDDSNMDLYSDDRLDSAGHLFSDGHLSSDARNTPLPPPARDEVDFPLDFDDHPDTTARSRGVEEAPDDGLLGELSDEDDEDDGLLGPLSDEEDDGLLGELSDELDLDAQNETEAEQTGQDEMRQVSVAPTSASSGGLFVPDEHETRGFAEALAWERQVSVAPTSASEGGLFVPDEGDTRRFADALAWEEDGEGDDEDMEDNVEVRRR